MKRLRKREGNGVGQPRPVIFFRAPSGRGLLVSTMSTNFVSIGEKGGREAKGVRRKDSIIAALAGTGPPGLVPRRQFVVVEV